MKKAFALMFSSIFCLYLPTFSIGADFHVSTNGSDSLTCGAIDSPCKTLWRALQSVDSGTNVIKVASGNYSENVTVSSPMSSLTIQGGWDEAFSSQLCSPANTLFTAPGATPLVFLAEAGESINAAIQCIQISNQANNLNQGVHIIATGVGASIDFSMNNCKVDSFVLHGVKIATNTNGVIQASFEDNLIYDNQQPINTGQAGAGMRFVATTGASLTLQLQRNRIINNVSKTAGGGILFSTESSGSIEATLENNIIAENQGAPGAGFYANTQPSAPTSGDIDLTLTNNTITNNEAAGGLGGGFYLQSDSNTVSAKLRNNIVWGNISDSGDDIAMTMVPWTPDDGSGINVDYSIVGEVHVLAGQGNYVEGAHNLSTNPGLGSDYLLKGNSAAINTGQCGYVNLIYQRVAPNDDIEGETRPGYNQLDGCDIGADQYNSFLCFPVKNMQGNINIICF